MIDTFCLVAGNREPALFYQLDPKTDLTGVTAKFSMRNRSTGVVAVSGQPAQIANGSYEIDGVMTALTPADCVLIYAWQAGDTGVPGVYDGRFDLTFPGSIPGSRPNCTEIDIHIRGTF